MNEEDLMKIAKKGEDSHSQFKSDVANPDSLAAEIVSLLNADGGTIYLGISDNGDISGLDGEDVRRLNLISEKSSRERKSADASNLLGRCMPTSNGQKPRLIGLTKPCSKIFSKGLTIFPFQLKHRIWRES